MQRFNKKDLVRGRSRAKILRANARRSKIVKIGGAILKRGNNDSMVEMARGYQKLRAKSTSMNDPSFVANIGPRIADTLLNEMGCCVIDVPRTFSLLQDQTDKERITNPNIFDPQFSTARAEKISPLTAYGEDDPFYVHDDKISIYKDLGPVMHSTPMATLSGASRLVAGMSLTRASGTGASLKYI